MQPHFKQTRQSALVLPQPVLFVQDTTELDFTGMTQARGYGPIGNHFGTGLLVHSLLALTSEGAVLGLGAQQCWARSDGPVRKGETSTQRKRRAHRESHVWGKSLEDVGPVPAGCRWVSVGDRGSDSFAYWNKARTLGWQCLSRVFVNRCTTESRLFEEARNAPSQGRLLVEQRARPGQAARALDLQVAWQPVEILPPKNDLQMRHEAPIQASIVRCWDDAHDIEWLLLATWPVASFEDAVQCVRWYEQRWSIEEFHKCLKSGCRIERSQLEQARATQALLAFASVVAVRLLALSRLARQAPQAPATQHIKSAELTVLCAVRKLDRERLTVHQFWHEVARIGGFLARKSDKDPGWQTLWKGLRTLDEWVNAWNDGYLQGQRCG